MFYFSLCYCYFSLLLVLLSYFSYICNMKRQEQLTFQRLRSNEQVQIGYSDEDIVIFDSVQEFSKLTSARFPLITIVICFSGKAHFLINDKTLLLHENQVAIIPHNVNMADILVSPDFNMKGLLLTNGILQSFLREKMQIWNKIMYIHHIHIFPMDEEDMLFYSKFHDLLRLTIERGKPHPYRVNVIRSQLRALILELCGSLSNMIPSSEKGSPSIHFQKFLDLLHSGNAKYRSVEEYAGDLCISPKYLTAICKKQSGKTAIHWIREQVLNDIRYYLQETDLNIKQICHKLDFPNPSFFGKYVKDHFGMTPMQLRNA